MVEGKTATSQVREIEEAWEKLKEKQRRMNKQETELYQIEVISFNNTANNQGVLAPAG
jgi:hypothetical protein